MAWRTSIMVRRWHIAVERFPVCHGLFSGGRHAKQKGKKKESIEKDVKVDRNLERTNRKILLSQKQWSMPRLEGSVKIRACRGPRMACCVRQNVSISMAKEYEAPAIARGYYSTNTIDYDLIRCQRKATYAQRSLLYYAERGAATERDIEDEQNG